MTTTGKQQTSFPPPPPPQIKSGEGGEIAEPHPNDVLCGRGGRINSHEGNIRFRDIVATLKPKYLNPFTKKVEKALIAAEVVAQIRSLSPPGRFLKETNKDGMWEEIGDDRARKKAGQALREDAPDLRAELSDDVIWSGEGAAINGLQRMVNMQQLLSPAAAGLGMIPQQSMYGAPTYAGYGQGNATDTQYSPDNNFFNTPNVVYSSAPFPQYYTQTVHQNQAQSYLPPQQWAYNSQTTSVLPAGTSQPMSQYAVAKKKKSEKKNSNAFPRTLHRMLQEAEHNGFQDIVSWQPHGQAFRIHDKQEFVKRILPIYFRMSTFASFQRQINVYCFNRLTTGSDKGAFYHELFRRDQPCLSLQMVSKRIKGNGTSALSRIGRSGVVSGRKAHASSLNGALNDGASASAMQDGLLHPTSEEKFDY